MAKEGTLAKPEKAEQQLERLGTQTEKTEPLANPKRDWTPASAIMLQTSKNLTFLIFAFIFHQLTLLSLAPSQTHTPL